MTRFKYCGLLVPALVVFALGCGKGNPNAPARVKGEVSYKGKGTNGVEKPLTGGTITFYPQSGPPYSASIHEDGSYELTDVPTGSMVVVVENKSAKGKRADMQEYGKKNAGRIKGGNQKFELSPGPGQDQSSSNEDKWFPIPDKYTKKAKSPLTAEVKSGVNSLSFTLED